MDLFSSLLIEDWRCHIRFLIYLAIEMKNRHNSEKSTEHNKSLEAAEKKAENGKIIQFPGSRAINKNRIYSLFKQIFGEQNSL